MSRDSDLQDGDFYHSDSQPVASSLKSQQKLPETFQNTATMEFKRHPSCSEFQMPLLGSIVFEGQLLPASAFYGCFMTMSGTCSTMGNMPDNFRVILFLPFTCCSYKSVRLQQTANLRLKSDFC